MNETDRLRIRNKMTAVMQDIVEHPATLATVLSHQIAPLVDEMVFDVEEYRADLERRRDSLQERYDQYYEKWMSGTRSTRDLDDAMRCMHKIQGIGIALSLLPPKEES